MNIAEGFQLEHPLLFLRWGASESELCDALPEGRRVVPGYVTAPCVSMGGLACQVGLHFRATESGGLAEVEIFRGGDLEVAVSFSDFQRHLEGAFGPSTETRPGDRGTTSHLWRIGDVRIVHELIYRFGDEEYVLIRAPEQPPFGAGPGDSISWP